LWGCPRGPTVQVMTPARPGLGMEPSEEDDTERQDERAFEEAGLYDPTSPTAADRLAALRYMVDHGTSIAYLKAGNDRGRLFAGQTMSVLWGDIEWLTLGELADRAGLDEDTLRRLRPACGLPDPGAERACPAVEVELWQAAAAAIALVGEQSLSGFLRSLGAAASASAEATLALARDANPLSWQSEAGYAEWALRGARLVEQIPRTLDLLFRLHVPLAGDRILRYAEAPEEFTEFTVGFVDLVDSTSVVERLGPQEVVRAMADFARLALTSAVSSGARLVKLIGDEAMFAHRDPGRVARTVGELVAAVEHHALLRGARGGMATGAVVPAQGDYFGPAVNLAARITKEGGFGEVLCDTATAAALGSGEEIGTRRLRGFADPFPLVRVQGPGDEPGPHVSD
jgi:adenylate cyclase